MTPFVSLATEGFLLFSMQETSTRMITWAHICYCCNELSYTYITCILCTNKDYYYAMELNCLINHLANASDSVMNRSHLGDPKNILSICALVELANVLHSDTYHSDGVSPDQ